MWPIYYALGLTFLGTRTTLSLRNLGFTTTQSNLLSVPSKVLEVLLLLASCYPSSIINSRVAATVLLQLWALPSSSRSPRSARRRSRRAYLAVVSLSQASRTCARCTSRGVEELIWVGTWTASASLSTMFVQAGGIVAVRSQGILFRADVYRDDDKARRPPKLGLRSASPRLLTASFSFLTASLSVTRRTDGMRQVDTAVQTNVGTARSSRSR
ncbi:uncharacterized protein BXZ73DRAFT_106259 [Epithele typhae]|uniref:uncharacterized protein n=1 Tax=Epithele typhae TaxID=378194 RepID=UPI002007AF68|nr:uncharacterized protein BXZ73DRAFT_106259 [Epithele typhae]KAH9915288.1 hypothetical protein BXZ73DRAFT_106259 [Epithele typhae]